MFDCYHKDLRRNKGMAYFWSLVSPVYTPVNIIQYYVLQQQQEQRAAWSHRRYFSQQGLGQGRGGDGIHPKFYRRRKRLPEDFDINFTVALSPRQINALRRVVHASTWNKSRKTSI